jgi:glutamate-ammonia-ligase adenylyltransferase
MVIKQVLPALLDWFSDGVEPDRALLAFRRLSESLSSSGWFLKMLRDSGLAAKSVAEVLSLSGYATELLLRQPAAVAWLDRYDNLEARDLADPQRRGRRTAQTPWSRACHADP